ncbi:DUF397 domain-containing protein [Streptomyces sp. NPDC058000]|uniref:DUF397 domain-containing protein n=1 Tax=Streptomyces sp. NPDC058000 TaxID=3346299 RepID=UPI0036E99801
MTAFEFRKSSHSGSQGECVEVARNVPGFTAVRDSKDASGPKVLVDEGAWDSFIAALKNG